MKKLLIIALTLCTTYIANCQKCITKTDPFNNDTISSYEYQYAGIRFLKYESKGGINTFEFRAAEATGIDYTVPKGSEILFKFDDGSIVKLFTLEDSKSVVSVTGASGTTLTYSNYYLKAEVSTEQLQKFASLKLTDFRYPDLHGTFKDHEAKKMNKKWVKSLTAGAKCLLGIK